MSDSLPDRVLTRDQIVNEDWTYAELVAHDNALRAACVAAEAERDAQAAENDHYQQKCIELVDEVCTLRAQVAALTAEREALVPLVRLAGLVLESVQQGQPLTAFDVEFAAEHYGVDLTAARAILGRVP